ncbi:MAG: hypothetical protein LBB98_00710 [Treponema sp.]|nr:hypothetical protein [Treponema sp.]
MEHILNEGKIHELSFMDHTSGQGQYRNLEIYAQFTAGWDVEGVQSLEQKRVSALEILMEPLIV